MSFFDKEDETNEAYQKAFELVKSYTPEEFAKWKRAISKAYNAHQEFKAIQKEEPQDDIELVEKDLEYIETEEHESNKKVAKRK